MGNSNSRNQKNRNSASSTKNGLKAAKKSGCRSPLLPKISSSKAKAAASAKALPKGGVYLESGRGYRGSVTVNGQRHRTRRHATRAAALRELNAIRGELMETL